LTEYSKSLFQKTDAWLMLGGRKLLAIAFVVYPLKEKFLK